MRLLGAVALPVFVFADVEEEEGGAAICEFGIDSGPTKPVGCSIATNSEIIKKNIHMKILTDLRSFCYSYFIGSSTAVFVIKDSRLEALSLHTTKLIQDGIM